jgi:carboxyl-terminal processing protease
VYNLDGGYALKMTTGKWFTPAGRSIQKERKLLPDGQFVEVHPDSMESDSARRARPTYKSTAGRQLYGGGAITPDLSIRPDTFTTAEQQLLRALAPKRAEFYVTLYDYGVQMKTQLRSDFQVQPAWREELYGRLKKKGVEVDRAVWDAGQRYIDREIEGRLARMAFGDSTARRRALPDDPPLQRAIAILKTGPSTKELIALAARPANK